MFDLIGTTTAVCGGSDHGPAGTFEKQRDRFFDRHPRPTTEDFRERPFGIPPSHTIKL